MASQGARNRQGNVVIVGKAGQLVPGYWDKKGLYPGKKFLIGQIERSRAGNGGIRPRHRNFKDGGDLTADPTIILNACQVPQELFLKA